ncbi:MAG: COX15/CtaA family protein, partial [Rhodospirillales bacterium]|nr:COX15/CtaA family protein [Rhodospirillales bacterium]
ISALGLAVLCAMVFVMVVLGGVTRLTHSGLSMVEWRPLTGWLPPLSEGEWRDAFGKYQQFPEYRELNYAMGLGGFKSIYWHEYLHRLWGRLIGVAFVLPFAVFALLGWLNRPLAGRLGLAFVLGGLQGVLGWYMVKSGLINEPDVSQYRLTAHLGAAFVIFGYLLWLIFGLLAPGARRVVAPERRALVRFAVVATGLILVMALSGGFVAGLDAGFIYNTFPLMEGRLIPDNLFEATPWYINPFENIITAQFLHRLLAVVVVAAVALLWSRSRRWALDGAARRAINMLVLLIVVQAGLGIATLLLVVPVALGAAHQAGAFVLFACALWVVHALNFTVAQVDDKKAFVEQTVTGPGSDG